MIVITSHHKEKNVHMKVNVSIKTSAKRQQWEGRETTFHTYQQQVHKEKQERSLNFKKNHKYFYCRP